MTNATDAKVEQVQRWSAEVQHGTLGSATRHYADPHGSWVHHDDYAALQAEVARHKEYAADAAAAKLAAGLAQRRTEAEAARLRTVDEAMVGRALRSYWGTKGKTFTKDKCHAMRRALIAAIQGSANGQG